MISIVVSLIYILKLVVLVKFSLSHTKIKKIPEKIFVMINKDERGGGTSFRFYEGRGKQVLDFMRDTTVMRGGHRAHGG